ncbi:uncharacterized protein BX664DRAFT_342004 [Halteromyces radiatus]|uniref:uncharacterized protein n=1 Tax=Halteromyces radiatus TaxID=101107 RepID=UPI00222073D3|nr:uncharacterized protein BX664DRAFT_342004 [Halteromyces radiatus]KAI8079991.1 hypothetical protein BX664DRAFT_342004 [Halteromyces radiatus]
MERSSQQWGRSFVVSKEHKSRQRRLLDEHTIFVSPTANANEMMIERDLIKNEGLLKQLNVDGDAQDLFNYIIQNKKICIVVLDYAGFSMNTGYLFSIS